MDNSTEPNVSVVPIDTIPEPNVSVISIETLSDSIPQTSIGPSGPLMTINELLGIQEALLKKEADDTTLLNDFFQPNDIVLKEMLVHWATIGFPDASIISSIQVNPPPKCSDSEIRNFYYYSLYLLKITDLIPLMDAIDGRVTGMKFGFSTSNINTINLLISKEIS